MNSATYRQHRQKTVAVDTGEEGPGRAGPGRGPCVGDRSAEGQRDLVLRPGGRGSSQARVLKDVRRDEAMDHGRAQVGGLPGGCIHISSATLPRIRQPFPGVPPFFPNGVREGGTAPVGVTGHSVRLRFT
jgi:hypothetical protein